MVKVWTCLPVGEVMGGLRGCLSWRGVMTCQVGRASGKAWPRSIWSSQIMIPSPQQLRLWCIKRDLCLHWPKGGNAEAGATAGTSYGLLPVSRPARESNSVTERKAVVGVSAVSDALPLFLGLLGALWLVSPLWLVRTTEGQWRSRRREHFHLLNPTRHEPFKDSLDLHLQWHYMVLFDTESDAIKVCGT